jgi:hypothetical protein
MNPRSRIPIGALLAAVVAVVVGWQESAISKVRAANRSLVQQAAEATELRAERDRAAEQARVDEANARSARDRDELQRLRRDVGPLRGRFATTPVRRPESAPATPDRRAPGTVINFRDAQDVGAASGEDLLQTFAWAMRTGNVKRLQELGDWSADGASESSEKFARELAKGAAEASGQDLETMSLRVIRQVPLDDGDSAMVIEARHGNDNHRSAPRIRRIGNEWKLVMGPSGPEEVQLEEAPDGD